MSSGSKPGDHERLAVVGGDELERARADDRRDVAGADEAVEPQVGRVEQRPQRRHDRDVVAHAEEVRDALGLGALQGQRGRGGGGLEADREEDDVAVGVLPSRSAARRAASRPCGCRRPRPWRRCSVCSEPGTRIMSPKQVKITSVAAGDRDAVVDAAHRDHADRAAGAVDELDVLGQQVVDPVLVDRVGVAAADLHHLVVAARLDRGEDLAGQRPAELGVAVLVDERITPAPRSASACGDRGAGVDEQRVARRAPARPGRSRRSAAAPGLVRRRARARARGRCARPASRPPRPRR